VRLTNQLSPGNPNENGCKVHYRGQIVTVQPDNGVPAHRKSATSDRAEQVKRILVRFALSALGALPVTLALAVFTIPLLNWLERATGIELVGHSGPSEWVLWIYLVLSAAAIYLALACVERGKS
jgi:hypothetical protein